MQFRTWGENQMHAQCYATETDKYKRKKNDIDSSMK